MDIKQLENWVKGIKVTNMVNADVEVENLSPMQMIGKGRQGAVFQFSDDICVKVFGNQEDCEREHYALSLGQHTNLLPKVYAKGKLYIAMEIIRGVDLREYLQSQPLTWELSLRLIEMLTTFKEIGYERIDHHKRQIYLQSDGSLKVIDVARTIWRDRVYPYPRKLLNSLGEEYKELFLQHVQWFARPLYEEWQHYIRMEELSRDIYQVLIQQPPDKDKVSKVSEILQVKDNEQEHVKQLSGLMYKVFKEEWIKTMLARGSDPDKVLEKIEEYWDKREAELGVYMNRKDESDDWDRYSKRKYSGEKSSRKEKGQDKKGEYKSDNRSESKKMVEKKNHGEGHERTHRRGHREERDKRHDRRDFHGERRKR
ncbi:hypothetical protein [Neobacillus sp. LXY-1]|uniref:hypothetical protein n=1 Tax=Neobacillus sp. LXY-1 TaxID=3379133 RepID=UPI003EE015CD